MFINHTIIKKHCIIDKIKQNNNNKMVFKNVDSMSLYKYLHASLFIVVSLLRNGDTILYDRANDWEEEEEEEEEEGVQGRSGALSLAILYQI